jgi:hypothetical protein
MFSIRGMVEAGEPVTVSSRAFKSAALADGTVRQVRVRSHRPLRGKDNDAGRGCAPRSGEVDKEARWR